MRIWHNELRAPDHVDRTEVQPRWMLYGPCDGFQPNTVQVTLTIKILTHAP